MENKIISVKATFYTEDSLNFTPLYNNIILKVVVIFDEEFIGGPVSPVHQKITFLCIDYDNLC